MPETEGSTKQKPEKSLKIRQKCGTAADIRWIVKKVFWKLRESREKNRCGRSRNREQRTKNKEYAVTEVQAYGLDFLIRFTAQALYNGQEPIKCNIMTRLKKIQGTFDKNWQGKTWKRRDWTGLDRTCNRRKACQVSDRYTQSSVQSLW